MHNRHLTLGSLALVALIGAGSGLLPSAAAPGEPRLRGLPGLSADLRGCGQPEAPAQWGSIEHPAVTRSVPARTRTESRWQRTTPTLEREYVRESAAAVVLVHWTRAASSGVEEQDLPLGEQPPGAGWVAGATSEISAAEEERIWLPDGTAPEAGFTATGATRPGTPKVETTDAGSALPPAGDGWTALPGSAVEVVVEAAHEVVEPAWVEDFIVVPAQPATPACPQPGEGPGVLSLDAGVDPPIVVTAGALAPGSAAAPSSALPSSGA